MKLDTTTPTEVPAARKALEALATTAQAAVDKHGGRAVAAGLAGLVTLYIRDLPEDEAKRVADLAGEVVRDYDEHAATRGEA